jgi:uncharacterized protein (DUF305 family)
MTQRVTLGRALALLGLLVATLALAACGSGDDQQTAAPAPTPRANEVDRAFASEMVIHHDMAIQMARMAEQQARRPEIKTLAADIVRTQQAEVELLERVGRQIGATRAGDTHGMDHGSMEHGGEGSALGLSREEMGMDMSMEDMRMARPFERMFIDQMIPHHAGAIRMARVELRRGVNPELRGLAQRVIDAQSREIEQMKRWRASWFGAPSATGG